MAFDVPCPEQDELPNEPGCQLRCQRMWRGGWSYGRGRNGSRSRGARAPADACKHAYQLCAQLPSCKTVQINKAGTWATLKSRNVSAAEQRHAKAAVPSRLRRFDRTQGVPVLHACSQHSQPAAPAFQAAGSKGTVDVSDGAATLSKQGFALLADLERVQSTGSCRNVQVHNLHYWGLYSMLNQLVRALAHSFAHGKRACFLAPKDWSYQPAAQCEPGLRCYFDSPLTCEECGTLNVPPFRGVINEAIGLRRQSSAAQPSEVEYVVSSELRSLSERYFGANSTEFAMIRHLLTRWVFKLSAGARFRLDVRRRNMRQRNMIRSISPISSAPGNVSEASVEASSSLSARDFRTRRPSPSYVSVHIRWGDKLKRSDHARKIQVSAYVHAAENLARSAAAPIVIFSTAANEVEQDLVSLRRSASARGRVLRFVNLSRIAMAPHLKGRAAATNSWLLREQEHTADSERRGAGSEGLRGGWDATRRAMTNGQDNAYDALADMSLMAAGSGAVVTFSSNMGRWLYFLVYSRIQRGDFQICSLDRPSPSLAALEMPFLF